MADFPVIRNLPAFHQNLSRRAALGGLAAVSAGTALPAIAGTNPDAELIARCQAWHLAKVEVDRLFAEASRLEEDALDKHPEPPAALYEALDLPGGRQGPDAGEPWKLSTLEDYADTGRVFHCSKESAPEDGLIITCSNLPIVESTRARCAELVAIHKAYEAEIDRIDTATNEADALASEASTRHWDDAAAICQIPARTLGGVRAKVGVIKASQAATTALEDFALLGEGLLADIEALS